MGYDLFPSKSGMGGMEPVALIGHNVKIMYANTQSYRKVIYFEPIMPFQFLNIGAVAAASTSARVQGTNLQMWKNEFGQFRWYTIDNAQIRWYLPNVDGRGNLRNLTVPMDPTIIARDPDLHLTEMFVWEDRNPSFEAINYTAQALTQCRLIAQGYRFVTGPVSATEVTKIQNGQLQCTNIVASGFAGQPSAQ
jgi:hypothetical protein